jgi:hypothetical protein
MFEATDKLTLSGKDFATRFRISDRTHLTTQEEIGGQIEAFDRLLATFQGRATPVGRAPFTDVQYRECADTLLRSDDVQIVTYADALFKHVLANLSSLFDTALESFCSTTYFARFDRDRASQLTASSAWVLRPLVYEPVTGRGHLGMLRRIAAEVFGEEASVRTKQIYDPESDRFEETTEVSYASASRPLEDIVGLHEKFLGMYLSAVPPEVRSQINLSWNVAEADV